MLLHCRLLYYTLLHHQPAPTHLPCAISAWYGVYCVYQPGFSSTLRRMTAGKVRHQDNKQRSPQLDSARVI